MPVFAVVFLYIFEYKNPIRALKSSKKIYIGGVNLKKMGVGVGGGSEEKKHGF